MSDYLWFSDAQWARIAPLLPADVRGTKQMDDRRVPGDDSHLTPAMPLAHVTRQTTPVMAAI